MTHQKAENLSNRSTGVLKVICLWTVLMKMIRYELWQLSEGLHLLFPRKGTERRLGTMIAGFTNVVTRLSVFSSASSVFARFFTRHDKLDITYLSIVTLALIFDTLYMLTCSKFIFHFILSFSS